LSVTKLIKCLNLPSAIQLLRYSALCAIINYIKATIVCQQVQWAGPSIFYSVLKRSLFQVIPEVRLYIKDDYKPVILRFTSAQCWSTMEIQIQNFVQQNLQECQHD